MQRVINGIMYDTQNATRLAETDNELNPLDYYYVNEILYCSKDAGYFLLAKGGPMSGYAERRGTGAVAGERIIPLTEEDAKRWAEYLAPSEIETIFGASDNGDSKVTS